MLYEEEMKDNKRGVPNEFSNNIDAFMWMNGEPKFGTNFIKWCYSIPDDVSVGVDWSMSGHESHYCIPNESIKRH